MLLEIAADESDAAAADSCCENDTDFFKISAAVVVAIGSGSVGAGEDLTNRPFFRFFFRAAVAAATEAGEGVGAGTSAGA